MCCIRVSAGKRYLGHSLCTCSLLIAYPAGHVRVSSESCHWAPLTCPFTPPASHIWIPSRALFFSSKYLQKFFPTLPIEFKLFIFLSCRRYPLSLLPWCIRPQLNFQFRISSCYMQGRFQIRSPSTSCEVCGLRLWDGIDEELDRLTLLNIHRALGVSRAHLVASHAVLACRLLPGFAKSCLLPSYKTARISGLTMVIQNAQTIPMSLERQKTKLRFSSAADFVNMRLTGVTLLRGLLPHLSQFTVVAHHVLSSGFEASLPNPCQNSPVRPALRCSRIGF
ncbi:hypothetical protein AVEN_235887-1 [Araneus ventricosus]|uniref:Uncharacterized protein n=1 Tax=Araneus ventricosus TaxID=182803 RepID=A0A4Y2N0M1_ARAVE|nr:hypothetical protein AVEN_235887-1 [Araneus ventricosus]